VAIVINHFGLLVFTIRDKFFFHHRIQNVWLTQPSVKLVQGRVWSWPFAYISREGLEFITLYLHSPHTPFWYVASMNECMHKEWVIIIRPLHRDLQWSVVLPLLVCCLGTWVILSYLYIFRVQRWQYCPCGPDRCSSPRRNIEIFIDFIIHVLISTSLTVCTTLTVLHGASPESQSCSPLPCTFTFCPLPDKCRIPMLSIAFDFILMIHCNLSTYGINLDRWHIKIVWSWSQWYSLYSYLCFTVLLPPFNEVQ
jgi:hypothetical protein